MIRTLLLTMALLISTCRSQSPVHPGKEQVKIDINQALLDTTNLKMFRMNGGTFDVDVYVVITSDIRVAEFIINKVIPNRVTAKSFKDNVGIVFYEDGYAPIMWLPGIPHSTEELAVANHEIFHLVVRIMNWVNVPLGDNSEEVYAYEIQHLSKQFYDNIIK